MAHFCAAGRKKMADVTEKLKKPIPEEQKWPTSPKKLQKPINPNHPALPWHRSLGDSPIRSKSPMVWKNWFFGFVGDVGHFCFSGIGFFGFLVTSATFVSCHAKVADVTKKTNVSRPRQLSAEEPDGLEELVFFKFFCDVGHFCPSGIGFFGCFGDVGHGKPSLCRPTTGILLCVLPPMPPEGFLFVEPHQGIPALCAPSRGAFSVEPHQGVPSFCAPTHGLLKVNGIHQRNPSLCAPTP